MNQNYKKKGIVVFIALFFLGGLLTPNITGKTIKD